jgi:hypothetical protein
MDISAAGNFIIIDIYHCWDAKKHSGFSW